MRSRHIIAVLAIGVSVLLISDSSVAQTRAAQSARQLAAVRLEQSPAVRFRPRAAAERAALARQLGAVVRGNQVAAGFSLTPRINYIPNRAILYITRGSVDPGFDTTGSIEFSSQDLAHLGVRLLGLNNTRLLVDCAVSVFNSVKLRVYMHSGVTYEAEFTATDGHIFFLTPVIPNTAVIIIDANQPGQDWVGSWSVTGCEFTPI